MFDAVLLCFSVGDVPCAGHVLLQHEAGRHGRGGRHGDPPALRRLEPPPHRLPVGAARPPRPQLHPQVPGGQQPQDFTCVPGRGPGTLPVCGHQRHDRLLPAELRGSTQHTV